MEMKMGYAMAAQAPGGAEVIHRIEIGEITPAPGEVVIAHEAIGVNFIDIYIRTGVYPWPVDKDLVLGSEGAGTVTAVGAGVTHLAVGDRVGYTLPNGAYATHRAINADMVVRLPDAIASDIAAAIMLKGLTVAYLVTRSYAVGAGDTVLFHAAAGGVGLLAGQWMKSLGATTIGTAGGAEKCALAKANGYDHVIDYRSRDFEEEVMRITDGAGVNVVYDSVGNDTMAKSLKCARRHGTVVNFGQSSGAYADFRIKDLAAGSLFLTRPTLFHFATERDWLESASAAMFARVADGTLNVSINRRAPLENVAEVHQALAARQTTGCTILTV
jgi:NADPH2:quinone reductase